MSGLRLFTALWNEERIDQFKAGPLKSLLWPRNKAALEGATWSVWTLPEHLEALERLIYNAIDVKFEGHLLPDIKDQNGRLAPAYYLLKDPLFSEMVACLNTSSKFLMLPPDTIFGEGTIPNIMKIGEYPGSCVAIPHIRVLPHILHHITDEPLSNAKLCGAALKTLHKSWVDAEKGSEINNSFWSGVSWEKIDSDLYSVTHRIPTVYYASFDGRDHTFWQSQATFSGYDHRWPGECLIRQGRQRMPGSSDLAMICEITGPGDNIPSANPPEQDPEWYCNDVLHAHHNRQSQFIMRAD